jgi:hypothetical protein
MFLGACGGVEPARELAALRAQVPELVKAKKWDELAETTDRILKLDPKNVDVRRHAAWNLSYNLSAEPDDVKKRYEWVRRGILLLVDGMDLDAKNAVFARDAGWFIAHKIGRSDDHREFRRLFAVDAALHARLEKHIRMREARGPEGKPDNWLAGVLLMRRAVELADFRNPTEGSPNPLVLLSEPGSCLINYARALDEEGRPGEVVLRAWRDAEKEWRAFGDREIPMGKGDAVRLNDREKLAAKVDGLWRTFDRLEPGLRDRLRDMAEKALPERVREAMRTPSEKRTDEQVALAQSGEDAIGPSIGTLSKRAQGPSRDEALRIAREAFATEREVQRSESYAGVVDFDYWLVRCQSEQSDVVRQARALVVDAERELSQSRKAIDAAGGHAEKRDEQAFGHWTKARGLYDQAFDKWAEAANRFPRLLAGDATVDELKDMVDHYREVFLGGKPLPENSPLRVIAKIWEQRNQGRH